MTQCPKTGTRGKKVDTATIKSMLSTSLRDVLAEPYYFCDARDCEIVYFSENGTHLITTDSIRESVYQKEFDNNDVNICYCFQHTVHDVKQAVAHEEEQHIIDDIKLGIQTEQCACDWRNPQGNCCLGNVLALIKNLQSPEM